MVGTFTSVSEDIILVVVNKISMIGFSVVSENRVLFVMWLLLVMGSEFRVRERVSVVFILVAVEFGSEGVCVVDISAIPLSVSLVSIYFVVWVNLMSPSIKIVLLCLSLVVWGFMMRSFMVYWNLVV